MHEVLARWREAYEGDHPAACAAAALTLEDPWQVVEQAGALARATVTVVEERTGVGARLQRLKPESRATIAVFEAGEACPLADPAARKRRGAWDTSRALARRLPIGRDVLDPACGTGAFLLAASEGGARRIRGWDTDPAAVAVARVAVPGAQVECCDAFDRDERAEVVLCNPPFVASEHHDKAARQRLRERFDWLSGRFDLAVPFLAHAVGLARKRAALVLPSSLGVQPYAAPLRREWLAAHRIVDLDGRVPFEGAGVEVLVTTLEIGGGPAALPSGMHARELLRLANAPLDAALEPGDVELAERMRRHPELETLCEVDTGVVAHGPAGGKERLLSDERAEGRVPYVDAKDLIDGRVRWLDYRPAEMHRAKRPALFERPKILVQRLKGPHPVRAVVDRRGLYAGHTLSVVRPLQPMDLDRLLTLLKSPLIEGLLRIEKGPRLDLYPKDLRHLPVPLAFLDGSCAELAEAYGLTPADRARLQGLASLRHRL